MRTLTRLQTGFGYSTCTDLRAACPVRGWVNDLLLMRLRTELRDYVLKYAERFGMSTAYALDDFENTINKLSLKSRKQVKIRQFFRCCLAPYSTFVNGALGVFFTLCSFPEF